MNHLNVNKTGYVKCQICGEVFEAGQTVCPVCGMGPEHFVPVEKEGTSYRNDTEREYVILGSGRAAVSAAEAIRERDAGGNITMISAERELPYTRPMLTKQMFAELGETPFAFCEGADIINNLALETEYLIPGAIMCLLGVAAAYFIYLKKDIA